MEKKVIEQLLFDFYGELLTDKQKVIMDYYYNDDCNLAEIGNLVHVTRQGVYDTLKRSRALMEVYEEKLKLVERFLKNKALIDEVTKELEVVLLNKTITSNKKLLGELTEVKDKMDKISEDY